MKSENDHPVHTITLLVVMARRQYESCVVAVIFKRRSETGETAFESSHQDAPNPCLTF